MALPTDCTLDAWIDDLVRIAREQAALGRAGDAGMLFELSNHLADLRDQQRRGTEADPSPLKRVELLLGLRDRDTG